MPGRPAPSPAPSRKRARSTAPDARLVIDRLARTYPGATTELHHRNAFELLVATILSARSTDARVNTVTPALFARYPDARALARAPIPEVERIVQPTGFFRMKAKAIVTMSQQLVERHHGDVPASMEALVELPGVGRKTANVVLGHALGVPGLPVDRHVLRVAGRIGLAKAATPEAVEVELCRRLPPEQWTLASDCLILHGRRICRPRPLCPKCPVADQCLFFRRTGGVVERAGTAAAAGVRRASAPGRTLPKRARS
jgi:endonuclease-3